jgi:beta-galactosidase
VLSVKTNTIVDIAFAPELLSLDMGKPIAGLAGPQGELQNFQLQGGITQPKNGQWKPWTASSQIMKVPTFYKTSFKAIKASNNGAHPIYRVSVKGLSRGSVWLNGHNLGRYPLKLKVDGLYLPEPWLRIGTNDLVVFDEEGCPPSELSINREAATSRNVSALGIYP